MNASLSAVVSTLSSIFSFVAMVLFSLWIACIVSGCAFFLYNLYIYIYCARSLVLWFEHCGMIELLPHAWDTQGGINIGLPSS